MSKDMPQSAPMTLSQKEHQRKYWQQYYRDHKKSIAKKNTTWYERNRPYAIKLGRKWRKEHPGAYTAQVKKLSLRRFIDRWGGKAGALDHLNKRIAFLETVCHKMEEES